MQRALLLVVLFGVAWFLPGEERLTLISANPNWEEERLEMEISLSMTDHPPTPANRREASRLLENHLSELTLEALSSLVVNSQQQSREWFLQREGLIVEKDLPSLSKSFIFRYLMPGDDHAGWRAHYILPFYPHLIRLLIQEEKRRLPPLPSLPYAPSTPYTGVIIYAKGLFPSLGHQGKKVAFVPALLPRLFDEEMQLVFEPAMVERIFLLQWGAVGYRKNLSPKGYRDRVGAFPLYTMARKVFGKNHTDLVLPYAAVQKILSSQSGDRILREGRVIILYGEEEEPN